MSQIYQKQYTHQPIKSIRTPLPAAAATTRCPSELDATAFQFSAWARVRDQSAPLFVLRQMPYMVHALPRRSLGSVGQVGVTAYTYWPEAEQAMDCCHISVGALLLLQLRPPSIDR